MKVESNFYQREMAFDKKQEAYKKRKVDEKIKQERRAEFEREQIAKMVRDKEYLEAKKRSELKNIEEQSKEDSKQYHDKESSPKKHISINA